MVVRIFFFNSAYSITRKQLQARCRIKLMSKSSQYDTDWSSMVPWYVEFVYGGICIPLFFLKKSDGICKLAAATAKIWSMCRSQIKYIFQAGALAFCIVLLVLSGLNLKWVFYTVAIFNVDAWHDGKAFFPSSYDELIFFLQRNDQLIFHICSSTDIKRSWRGTRRLHSEPSWYIINVPSWSFRFGASSVADVRGSHKKKGRRFYTHEYSQTIEQPNAQNFS